MFRFANPEYLYWLVLVPVLALIYMLTTFWSKKRKLRYGDPDILFRLVPKASRMRPVIKFVLLEIALALAVLLVARPQFGLKEEKEIKNGIEAVIVMDVSNSMMAADVQPNRLERSKLLVSTLIDKMRNDKIALAVFAGEAYPQLPITDDYISAKMFLDAISTDMITLQGTNLAAAIDLARISFTDNKKAGKAVIIITDGENHEEGAVEAAKNAAKDGMKVFVLGVGSTDGALIQTPQGILTDAKGEPVRTRLNENMCKEIAQAGNGAYIHIDNTNLAQEQLQYHLQNLQKTSDTRTYSVYDEQFRAVALLVLILLFIEFFISETSGKLFGKFKLFER